MVINFVVFVVACKSTKFNYLKPTLSLIFKSAYVSQSLCHMLHYLTTLRITLFRYVAPLRKYLQESTYKWS